LLGDYKFEALSMLGKPANKKAHAEGEVRRRETGYSTALKLSAHRAGLPGKVKSITRSAFLPAHKAVHQADLPVTESSSESLN